MYKNVKSKINRHENYINRNFTTEKLDVFEYLRFTPINAYDANQLRRKGLEITADAWSTNFRKLLMENVFQRSKERKQYLGCH